MNRDTRDTNAYYFTWSPGQHECDQRQPAEIALRPQGGCASAMKAISDFPCLSYRLRQMSICVKCDVPHVFGRFVFSTSHNYIFKLPRPLYLDVTEEHKEETQILPPNNTAGMAYSGISFHGKNKVTRKCVIWP